MSNLRAEQTQDNIAKANLSYRAAGELLRLRPLPPRALSALVECLSLSDNPYARRYAATILAHHQRDVSTVSRAIQSARAEERDEEVQEDFDRAIERLAAVGEPLPVLVDSAQLTGLLNDSIVAAASIPGRRYMGSSLSGGGHSSSILGPAWEDLPELATIKDRGTVCKASLGWEWELSTRDGESQIEPVPVGALLRLHDPLSLKESSLSAGTLLMHTTFGWSVIAEEDAVKRMSGFLGLSKEQRYPLDCDYRTIGALGAAVVGPPAKRLVSDLARVAKSDGMPVFCAVAIAAIGDPAALPVLRQMRKENANWAGIVAVIDKAIGNLENE